MQKNTTSPKPKTHSKAGLTIIAVIGGIFVLCIIITLALVVIIAKTEPAILDVSGQPLSDDEEKLLENMRPMTYDTEIKDDPYLGNKNKAKIAIVNFSSYECEYCYRHHTVVFPSILETLVKNDLAIYVYKERAHSTIEYFNTINNTSDLAANAAKCVYKYKGNDSYFDYQQGVFAAAQKANFKSLEVDKLLSIAKKLGLNNEKVENCVKDSEQLSAVSDDVASGDPYVQGTPTFLIGNINEDGIVSGFVFTGNWEFEVFEDFVSILRKKPEIVDDYRPPWYVGTTSDSLNSFSMSPELESGGIILTPQVSYVDVNPGEDVGTTINFNFGDERKAFAPIFYYDITNILFDTDDCKLEDVNTAWRLGGTNTADWTKVSDSFGKEAGFDIKAKISVPEDIEKGVYGLAIQLKTDSKGIKSKDAYVFIRVGEENKEFECRD